MSVGSERTASALLSVVRDVQADVFSPVRRILHSKGELSEDRHKQYEEFATSYQKLLANTQSLADLLDENMPDLPQDKTVQEGVCDLFPVCFHLNESDIDSC